MLAVVPDDGLRPFHRVEEVLDATKHTLGGFAFMADHYCTRILPAHTSNSTASEEVCAETTLSGFRYKQARLPHLIDSALGTVQLEGHVLLTTFINHMKKS